jgi:hypothetical protein
MGRINSRVDLALKAASEILASTKNSVLKVQLMKLILDFDQRQQEGTELTNELDALKASTTREILALKSRLGVVDKLTFVNGMIMRCGQFLTQEEREKYGSDLFEKFKSSDGLLAEFFNLLGLDLSKWRKWESQYGEDSLAMVKAFENPIQNGAGMLSLLRLKLSKIGIDVDAINAARDYRDVKISLAELKQRATSHIRIETAG